MKSTGSTNNIYIIAHYYYDSFLSSDSDSDSGNSYTIPFFHHPIANTDKRAELTHYRITGKKRVVVVVLTRPSWRKKSEWELAL